MKTIKRILAIFEYLVIAAVVGFGLIVGVYAIPKDRMVNNITRSTPLLQTEGNYRYWAADILNTQSDNFSDSLMADIAINPNTGNLLYDSMINCYVGWRDTAESSEWLLRVAGGEPFYEGYEQVVYGRYWHGYLIWMKPLLLLFSIPEIRLINMSVQLVLLCWLMILLYRELGLAGCLSIGAGILILNPITCAMTFHFSDIYYNVLITCIVMLSFRSKFDEQESWWTVFLWSGIAVAFFDLMTYPLVALGIPLILYFLLSRKSFGSNTWELIHFSIDWVIGYAGMWALKWLIGSAFTGYNLIADGLGAVGLRSTGAVENVSMDYVYVVMNNVQAMLTKPVIAGLVFIAVLLVIGVLCGKMKFKLSTSKILQILVVGCFPFLWYYVIRNHSIVHVWFAYRVLAITVAAVVAMLFCFVSEKRGNTHEKN